MTAPGKPSLSPLRVREGARYTCFGDGLCCTDIHGLGPITQAEMVSIRRLDRKGAAYDDDFEDRMLCVAADGGCRFLETDQRCGVHAKFGPEAKPHGCNKFPYGLTATPTGGRIFTEHRCPCRTLGERPPLDPDAAVRSLREPNGKLDSDADVDRIRLDAKRSIPFAAWERDEAKLLARLFRGEAPAEVLAGEAFPKLEGTSWTKVGEEFVECKDGSRFGFALAWLGDTILHLREGTRPRPPGRPWADAFDRAVARSKKARKAREVLNDWVADRLWSLKWAESSTYATFAAEMATRIAIAESIASRLADQGLRGDRAMAEAVMMVEIVGVSEHWEDLVPKMRPKKLALALGLAAR